MRKTILLFLLFLSVTAVRTLGQNITFSHLTTDDGLSQFSVNSLYIDERGIIWIGTREGLNRYNGNDIKSFKLKKNDPNSLFSNTVLRITGNKNGKVYLLCTDGVAEFDMTTQRFKTLLQGNVDAIYYNEKLYIGKREEVFVFNENTNNFDLYYHLAGKDINLSCLHLDEKKNLWMGTTSNGVYCLSDDKQLSQPITKGNIASIYEDSSKELWIGSWEEGLYRIRTNGTIDNFRHDPKNPNSICSDFVRSCCEDNLGNLWIGTFHGLNRYDKSTGQFQLYTANDNKPDGLTHSSIWCIVKDEQGTLWLGTYFGGVNYFNPEYEIYTRYKVGDTEKEGLSSPIVGRMTEDKDGNLWICTEGGGVNVYNRKNNTYRWYRHEEGRNSISHNNVKAIYYDRTEEIMWIGTHLGGLNKLDLRTNRFTIYRMKAGDPTTYRYGGQPLHRQGRNAMGFRYRRGRIFLPLRHRQAHPLCTQSLHSEHSQQQQCQQHHAGQQRQPVVLHFRKRARPLPQGEQRLRKLRYAERRPIQRLYLRSIRVVHTKGRLAADYQSGILPV